MPTQARQARQEKPTRQAKVVTKISRNYLYFCSFFLFEAYFLGKWQKKR